MKGQGRVRTSILLALLLLAMPNATAESVQGHLLIEGAAGFPPGATAQFTPLAVLCSDTSNPSGFAFQVDSMRVTLYEKRYAVLGTVILRVDDSIKTWTQTNVELALLDDGDHRGYFGLKAERNGIMEATFLTPADVERRQESTISSDVEVLNPTPEYPAFHERVTQSHLYAKAPAYLRYHGDGTVHVNGLDFRLIATENRTAVEWRTGYIDVSPVEAVYRWFVFDVEGANISISPGSQVELAGVEATVAWQGDARMTPIAGVLRAPSGTYRPTGASAVLSGSLTAEVVPSDQVGRLELTDLRGDVRATDLHFQSAPFAPLQSATWIPWVALAVTATLGGGAGAFFWRRGRYALSSSAEQCNDWAALSNLSGDPDRALVLARRGRALAPRMASLAGHEAYALAAKNDVQGALKAYAEAHELANRGDFALSAARLLQEVGGPLDMIQERLEAALAKSPEELADIEFEFPEIVSRAGWSETARVARLRSK